MTLLSHAVVAVVSFVLGGFADSLIIGHITKHLATKLAESEAEADSWRLRALNAEDELTEAKAKLAMMSMGRAQ